MNDLMYEMQASNFSPTHICISSCLSSLVKVLCLPNPLPTHQHLWLSLKPHPFHFKSISCKLAVSDDGVRLRGEPSFTIGILIIS